MPSDRTRRREGRLTMLGSGTEPQNAQESTLGARRGPPPRKTAIGTLGPSEGPQRLILDGFPSPYMVARLGPNSGTINRYGLGRLRKDVQGYVKIAVTRQGIRPVAPPVTVTLRYVMPDARHRDVDNFAAIGKPVVDGLVRSGILAGDNAARLTQRVEFVKEPGARRLEIVIAPAPHSSSGAPGGRE